MCNVTWDAAIRTCNERGGKLYNTTDTSALNDVRSGSYWIGAKVQYSSWTWTGTEIRRYELDTMTVHRQIAHSGMGVDYCHIIYGF